MTRVVILTRSRAIKIVRIRPLRPFIRFAQLLLRRSVRTQLHTYHENIIMAAMRYLLSGLFANRKEYRVTQEGKCATHKLAPVTGYYLWGVVIVQERGANCTASDRLEHHPHWPDMVEEAEGSRGARRQFARFGDTVLLIDYGNPRLAL